MADQVFTIRVNVGDEALAEQTVTSAKPIVPVFTTRLVSTLPDRDGNRLAPVTAAVVEEGIRELSERLMEQALIGALLIDPTYQVSRVGCKLVEVSLVPKRAET